MNADVLIVGTGALATLFAARLSQAGSRVTMLGTWKGGLDALGKIGARLLDAQGDEYQFDVQVANDPHQCVDKHAPSLSRLGTERTAPIAECLAEDGVAVTLQNGPAIANAARSLGLDRAPLGTTTTGATPRSRFGKAGEGIISIERHPALDPMEEALRSARFNVHIVEDAQSLIWGKLVINAAINPLTALLRVPNGQLLERPSARRMMSSLAHETAEVASAEKIRLPFTDPIAAAEDVARKTGANHSSMFQDVLRGAPTEIDAICGAVVKTAQKHNIHTPANWACWNLVKALVN
jgi:2-dehydropantoate 2-reductase